MQHRFIKKRNCIDEFIIAAKKKMLTINIYVEKNDEMRCDSNLKAKLDRIKFHEHSFEMFRKS